MHRWNERLAESGRRLLARAAADARGSAALEFLGLGVLLLVPLAYGAIALGQLEQALLATELAARNGARVLADDPDGTALAEEHVHWALADHGIDPGTAAVDVRCAPAPDCAIAGDTLTVTVRVEVALPFIPGAAEWLTVPVESAATFPRERIGVGG